jgi:tRNA(Ile)-lysidine synthase
VTSRTTTLQQRFLDHRAELGLDRPGVHLLVAVSGGCDSVVLLHLLRFAAGPAPPAVTVAHLDHRMRSGSAADARWVAGLCRAWGIRLVAGQARVALRSELQARRERYGFLRRVAREVGATHIATAHHADDQAETVLFRILRGTGLQGLAGIAPLSPAGIVRPLLPFWRGEIQRYARGAGLRWRSDPTNRSLHPARNRLRRKVLPLIERELAPAARRNLVRLAELAREAEAGWDSILGPLEPIATETEDDTGGIVLARAVFRQYHPALGSRLLRKLLARLGIALDRAGTRMALQFITDAPSGREFRLAAGVVMRAEFDRVVVGPRPRRSVDRPLTIAAEAPRGSGDLVVGGRQYGVSWAVAPSRPADAAAQRSWSAAFGLGTVRFPLCLRGWQPGDRIRLQAGSRRLKKVFVDRRVPRSRRAQLPILVDSEGTVLWVAGVVQAPASIARRERDALYLTITHA